MNTKVFHEWGMNLFIVEGNGTTKTIVVRKRLDKTSRRKEVILCYDFFNEVTKEKEDTLFTTYPNLLTI
jgi:hypothetical protein